MANPIAGEIAFEAQGEAYVLCYDFNALCALEALFGDQSIVEIAAKIGDGMKLTDLRTIFAAGLRHEQGPVAEMAAGVIIGAIGPTLAATKMAEAMSAAFPKEAAPKGGARPPKPAKAGGTGKTRARPGANSAGSPPPSGG
jgi:hypothetical protein